MRLRVLEYLLCGGWSKHRITTEEAIDFPKRETSLRTDLICYTQKFDPFLLVECKAENIELSEKAASQIARYNQNIGAPYLLITNGVADFWYAIRKDEPVKALDNIPEVLPRPVQAETNFNYWKTRGFAGAKAAPDLRTWLEEVLQRNLSDENRAQLQFLSFKKSPVDIELSHYYHIYQLENNRLALGFLATAYGGSRIIGIINSNGRNEAVLEINLDLLLDGRAPNATIYRTGKTKNMDIRSDLSLGNDEPFDGKKTAKIISTLLANALK